MERQRDDYHHHGNHRINHSDHQEQHPYYYQHQNQNQHQYIQHHHNPCFHRHDPFAEQNNDYQFNNHDYHSNYGTNPQTRLCEPNEPFGVGGGGGGFCFNDRKRGRNPSGRAVSPGHNGDAVNAKLYVAPILRTTTEEEIRPLFEQHGSVVEIILPRDKWTGQQQGYCFVKYAMIEEADRAIRALNGQYTVPGEAAPIKVRYADGKRERFGKVERDHLVKGERELPGGREFVDKLYVGCINKEASKQEIEEIFSPYGHVEDVYIARDTLKQSRGCAFIKFSYRDMAVAAMKALNGTFTMRGCDQPLVVRFADPKKRRTGESRGNYAFGGQNFGPCSQEQTIRPAPNFVDSVGGCLLPNPSYSMQEIPINSQPHVSHGINPVIGVPHMIQQPLPPINQPPTQLCQIPLQQIQATQKCLQSSQAAVSEMTKQIQNLEQQESVEIPLESPVTESNPPAVSLTSAAPSVPPSPQTADPEECDWSEHCCPDGYKYYYNCTTCESRWEKPEEFNLFQQQLLKKQKVQISGQPPKNLSASFCGEEVDQTEKGMDHVQIQSETSAVVDPACV